MIKRLSHVTVYVQDQEAAKDFYTKAFGFEVREDSEFEGFRWLTVGLKDQPDLEFILMEPAAPMFDEDTAAQLHELVAKGALGAGVFFTEDCRATVEELRSKGVTILSEPAERPYGIEATIRDDSGNWYSLTQRIGG